MDILKRLQQVVCLFFLAKSRLWKTKTFFTEKIFIQKKVLFDIYKNPTLKACQKYFVYMYNLRIHHVQFDNFIN